MQENPTKNRSRPQHQGEYRTQHSHNSSERNRQQVSWTFSLMKPSSTTTRPRTCTLAVGRPCRDCTEQEEHMSKTQTGARTDDHLIISLDLGEEREGSGSSMYSGCASTGTRQCCLSQAGFPGASRARTPAHRPTRIVPRPLSVAPESRNLPDSQSWGGGGGKGRAGEGVGY